MGELTVRGLDEETLAALAARAAQHGRSVEEEAAALIERRLAADILTPMGPNTPEIIEKLRMLGEETRGMIKSSTAEILEDSRQDRR